MYRNLILIMTLSCYIWTRNNIRGNEHNPVREFLEDVVSWYIKNSPVFDSLLIAMKR